MMYSSARTYTTGIAGVNLLTRRVAVKSQIAGVCGGRAGMEGSI